MSTLSPTAITPHGSAASRLTKLAAVLAALVFVTFLVLTTSRSAFTATTDNPDNSVASGSIMLVDDDGGATAMFTVTEALPGALGTKCITVTYNGTAALAAPVRLYRSGANTGTLDTYLTMGIDMGTGGAFADCSGFVPSSTLYAGSVSAFSTARTDFTSGLSTAWTPAPGQSRVFRFTLSLADDNTAQNKSATFGYTWEAQS